jgi:hypothetical protein
MMNEDKRKEAQRKLTEEERIRRLSEGGESMKAQLAMEEAERSSRGGESAERGNYLTPQEEQQRRMMKGAGEPYRGYGETQRAEMAMWSASKEGGQEMPSRRQMTQDEMRKTGIFLRSFPPLRDSSSVNMV